MDILAPNELFVGSNKDSFQIPAPQPHTFLFYLCPSEGQSDPVTVHVLLMWFGDMISRTYSQELSPSLVLQGRWPGLSY